MFLRRTTVGRDPLPVAMSGVRAGERALQIGIDDPQLAGALAAKVGLNGVAAFVVVDERSAEKARAGAAKAGVLAETHVSPLTSLPLPDGTFDLVVINSKAGLLASLSPEDRAKLLREGLRVLRVGGRLVAIEAGTPVGISALFGKGASSDSDYERRGGAVTELQAAGFLRVRPLADRDGYRFTEGLKSGT